MPASVTDSTLFSVIAKQCGPLGTAALRLFVCHPQLATGQGPLFETADRTVLTPLPHLVNSPLSTKMHQDCLHYVGLDNRCHSKAPDIHH
jgi:hypothetical protein